MDDFLRKIKLSEYAIEIYIKTIGKYPLSFYELFSIVPKANPEEFNKSLNELIDAGLLAKLTSEKQGTIIHYSTLPPILPILNYYNNINSNLKDIKHSIQELLINTVNELFRDNTTIELDSIIEEFQEIRKDINEDSIIQKQEVEDLVEGMEELKEIKQKVSDLNQKIKSVIQTNFADLIKTVNTLKTEIIDNINSMDFKRHKPEIISLIEQSFKEKFENMIGEFTNNLRELIEKEFNKTTEPMESTIELTFRYQNDFKMLLLGMLNNFETKMNRIHELLKENQEGLQPAMNKFETSITANLDAIIQHSVDEIANLNKPIEKVLHNYLQKISIVDKQLFTNVWIISSVTKINEIIQNLILHSKESLTIIIPHLENHLAVDQFDNLSGNLRIKIAASEAHTNSTVKSFKEIKNIVYKTYQNDNFVVIKADNDLFIIGVIQDSDNPLEDFIGIRTSFEPLTKLLDPLIRNIWEEAYSDSFHATQVSKTQISPATKPMKSFSTAKPIIPTKFQSQEVIKKIPKSEPVSPVSIPTQIQEISKEDQRSMESSPTETQATSFSSPKIEDLKQKLQEKLEFITAVQPKADDEAALEIDYRLNRLIDKLGNLKGDDFAKELEDIANIILEKKGFSVTLHKLRSTINKYKEMLTLLNENDKKEIIEDIESWKKKLF
ncbi:MAG: hypothetical protein ACFFCV_13700 [Promethearchaeota archaeon]